MPGKTVNMTMELKVGKWHTVGCTAGVCGKPAHAAMDRHDRVCTSAWVCVQVGFMTAGQTTITNSACPIQAVPRHKAFCISECSAVRQHK